MTDDVIAGPALIPGPRPTDPIPMADIVLINPRFEVSFWGMEHALPLFGKRANLPVACLPLLAALTPEGHTRHADRRERRADRLRPPRAGRHRRPDRHERAAVPDDGDPGASSRQRGCFTVVGGPWVTVAGGLLRRPGRRDLHRRGRGDLAAVPRGVGSRARTQSRYEQAEKTDMTKVPVPAVRPAEDRTATCSAACSSRAAARSSASSATSSSPSAGGRGSRRRQQVIAELDATAHRAASIWRSSSTTT